MVLDDCSPVPSSVPSEYEEEYDDLDENEHDEQRFEAQATVPASVVSEDVEDVLAAYTAAIAAIDGHDPHSPNRTAVATKSARGSTKAAAPALKKTKSARKSAAGGAAGADQPEMTAIDAHLRCAVRVGANVWAAERDGCIVVRCATSGKTIERIQPHGWEMIWSIAAVGASHVWCGTHSGPILVFDKQSRKYTSEMQKHKGGVNSIAQSPAGVSRSFVCTGGADFRMQMWTLEGKHVKTYSGHTGGVRCVLVLGMAIWTGSDDMSVRVWDAAFGLFQLATEPCKAVLSGHTGAIHCLLPHTDGVLSSAADGSVRCWKAGGTHECLRDVQLACGPVCALVPMGKHVWAAAQDGSIHTLDGASLAAVESASKRGHTGFVSGLCHLPARTTRQCWSFSSADGKVCRWRTEEVEAQLTSERAAQLGVTAASLQEHLMGEQAERAAEQARHAGERERDEARVREVEEALAQARAAQQALLNELAASMEVQEADVQEAERLRALLTERDAQLRERDVHHERLTEQIEQLTAAEAGAREEAAEARGQLEATHVHLDLANARLVRAATQQQAAERLARRSIAAAACAWVAGRRPGPLPEVHRDATRDFGEVDRMPEEEAPPQAEHVALAQHEVPEEA